MGTLDDPGNGKIDIANPLLDLNIDGPLNVNGPLNLNQSLNLDYPLYLNGLGMTVQNAYEATYYTLQFPNGYLKTVIYNTGSAMHFITDRDMYAFDEEIRVNGVLLTSDIRLKENIVTISNEGPSLDKLSKLEGIKYTFKDEKNGLEYAGFSAQELQKIIPHLVAEDEEGELSVNYIGLIPYLVEALKEQEEKINQLTILLKELSK